MFLMEPIIFYLIVFLPVLAVVLFTQNDNKHSQQESDAPKRKHTLIILGVGVLVLIVIVGLYFLS